MKRSPHKAKRIPTKKIHLGKSSKLTPFQAVIGITCGIIFLLSLLSILISPSGWQFLQIANGILVSATHPSEFLSRKPEQTVFYTPNTESPSPTRAITPCPTLPLNENIVFPSDGKVHELTQKINISGSDTNCSNGENTYYSAGIVRSGKYQGYKRIISYVPMGGATLYITKDLRNFALADSGVIDRDFPPDIPLPNHYALHRLGIFALPSTYMKYFNTKTPILTDYSIFTKLRTFQDSLSFYAQPINTKLYTNANTSQYFSELSTIIAVDESGLAYTYIITVPENINAWNHDKHENPSPSLRAKRTAIASQFQIQLYDTYDGAVFDQACGGHDGGSTLIAKTVTDTDVHKIGNWFGIDIFALNDSHHTLYTMLYHSIAGDGPNRSSQIPSYDDYIAKTPLLFVKDPWNRWIIIAETSFDPTYHFGSQAGGCGKPVMYLYPKMPTEVYISFESPMKLDVQIPLYRNGWKVLAKSNGLITDILQLPSDCKLISSNQRGSEYAPEACSRNEYPYIYWAGQTLDTYYLQPKEGSVIEKDKLLQFLSNTLEGIGFHSNEKKDMLSYWLPKMLDTGAPFYRISFLQTDEVNDLFPLHISPYPDSMYRLFMDWEPLKSLPLQKIPPQRLEKIQRNGFFMLEWGGVLRY